MEQAIFRANVDPDLRYQMASLGYNWLKGSHVKHCGYFKIKTAIYNLQV